MPDLKVNAPYEPTGDQPQAIAALADGLGQGLKLQVLLGATGFVLISANGDDGALIVDGLPPLGEDQEYQLWLIRDGERTSGAVFSTDERSYAGMRIRAPRSLLEYSAVGITIEPAGGSAYPTGAQVLRGTLRTP